MCENVPRSKGNNLRQNDQKCIDLRRHSKMNLNCTPRKSARKTEIVILTGIHLIATSFFVSLCSASFTSENAPLKYIFISCLKILGQKDC